MDNSSDISFEFSRSFAEYDSSGLEDSNIEQLYSKIENPITKTIDAVMRNKVASNSTLKSAHNVAKLINEIPESPITLPTNVQALKKSATMRFQREYYLFCDGCNDLCNKNNWCAKCETKTKKN